MLLRGVWADPSATQGVARFQLPRFEGQVAVHSRARAASDAFRAWRHRAAPEASLYAIARAVPSPPLGPLPAVWRPSSGTFFISPKPCPPSVTPTPPSDMTRGKSVNKSRRQLLQRTRNAPLHPPSLPCTCESLQDHGSMHAPRVASRGLSPRPFACLEVDGTPGDAIDLSSPRSDRWRCPCWLGSWLIGGRLRLHVNGLNYLM